MNVELPDEDRQFFRVGSFQHKDRREVIPLQAADILAYETCKEVVRRLTVGNQRPVREFIENPGKNETDGWRYCEKTQLLESVKGRLSRRRAYSK